MLGARPESVQRLTGGAYNETHLITVPSSGQFVLRLAPPEAQQFSSESHLMRNEYLGRPFLVDLGELLPEIVAADFSHAHVDRDVMIIRWVPGPTGAEFLRRCTHSEAQQLWRQLGEVLHRIHDITGSTFGRPAEPWSTRWSAALLVRLAKQQSDLRSVHAPADDLSAVAALIEQHAADVDGVPCRLTHGDLIPSNVVVAGNGGGPRIAGLLDLDRLIWGDPWSDWSIAQVHRASAGSTRAFWTGYRTPPPDDPAGRLRAFIYSCTALAEARLEHARRVNDDRVQLTVAQLQSTLAAMPSSTRTAAPDRP